MPDPSTPEPTSAPATATPPPLPRRRPRLPGTYAASFHDNDPNPGRSALVIGGLFTLVFLLESVRLSAEIFSGLTDDADNYAVIRVGFFSVTLALLWVGAGWIRWVGGTVAFIFGSGLLIQILALSPALRTTIPSVVVSAPLGIVYLAVFGYLGFSANAVAFAKMQGTPGRSVSAVPVVLGCGLCLAFLLGVRPMAMLWRDAEQRRALAFGDESLRAMSAHWDPQAFDERADPDYVAQWPVEAKKAVLADVSRVGAVRTLSSHSASVLGYLDLRTGFHWHGTYSADGSFEHGRALMSYEFERGVFTPWRITAWTLRPIPVDTPELTAPGT